MRVALAGALAVTALVVAGNAAAAPSIGGGTMQCTYFGGGGPGGQPFTTVHVEPPIAFGLNTSQYYDRQNMYWHSWLLIDGQWLDLGWKGTYTGWSVPEGVQAFWGAGTLSLTGQAVVYRYDQVQWQDVRTGATYNAYSWGSQYCAP
jgi:hypothetical protein